MDCDTNANTIDFEVIGPGATVSDIGADATLYLNPSSVVTLSHSETCHVANSNVPMNVSDFLTLIESSSRSDLVSIAESHRIALPSKPVSDVIRNLISASDHISSGDCLRSSVSACKILNSNFYGQDCDST